MNSSWAPPATRDRAAGASHSSRNLRCVSTIGGIPGAAEARKAAAIRDVRDRFYAEWLKLSADMQAEIRRIEREYM